jgi:hypothetical protein
MRVWVCSKFLKDSAEDLTSGINLLNYTIGVRRKRGWTFRRLTATSFLTLCLPLSEFGLELVREVCRWKQYSVNNILSVGMK